MIHAADQGTLTEKGAEQEALSQITSQLESKKKKPETNLKLFLFSFGEAEKGNRIQTKQKQEEYTLKELEELTEGFSNPYLLYDYKKKAALLCACSDPNGNCKVPEIPPSSTDENHIFFVARNFNEKNQQAILINSIRDGLLNNFKTIKDIKLCLNKPPTVYGRRMKQ